MFLQNIGKLVPTHDITSQKAVLFVTAVRTSNQTRKRKLLREEQD
jgi:hypothetical protein